MSNHTPDSSFHDPDIGAVTDPPSTTPVQASGLTRLDTVVEDTVTDSPEDLAEHDEQQGAAAYGWHRC